MFYNYDKLSVRDLADKLEQEAPLIKDKVVDSRDMNAVCTGPDGLVQISMPGFSEAPLSRKKFPMNEWAHRQMSQITKIPKVYYDRMREAERGDLLADNINAWQPQDKRRLVKTVDGEIRAFLSEKYKTIDNLNILRCTMEKLLEYKHLEPKFQECQLGTTRMYLKIQLAGLNGEAIPDDKYHFGMMITNSEVGAASLKLQPYMVRQVCTNGMIRETLMKRIHVGAVNSDIQASFETRLLQDAAIYSEFQDAIDHILGNGHFHTWLDDLQAATEVTIGEPTDAMENLATAYKITEKNQKMIQDYFFQEDVTQYGMIQGITRAAQDLTDIDEAVRWEGIAGELSAMNEDKFRKKIKAVA